MTLKEAKQLHKGDEVFWNDPDSGLCSRVYKINTIEVDKENKTATIQEDDGSVLECFLSELS